MTFRHGIPPEKIDPIAVLLFIMVLMFVGSLAAAFVTSEPLWLLVALVLGIIVMAG